MTTHDPATQASGDRMSPLLSLSKDERALARQRYAEDPTPFDALICESLRLVDRAEIQAAAAMVRVAREGL